MLLVLEEGEDEDVEMLAKLADFFLRNKLCALALTPLTIDERRERTGVPD